MEKLIVILAISLAIAILVNKINNLIKNPTCDSCDQQCSGCQMAALKKTPESEPTVIDIEGLK